jgi:hypothetical protein
MILAKETHITVNSDTGFRTLTLREGSDVEVSDIIIFDNREFCVVHHKGSAPILVRYDDRWEDYTYPEQNAKRYRFHIVYKDGAYTDKFVATNRGDKEAYKMMLESLGEAYVKNILNITLVPEEL